MIYHTRGRTVSTNGGKALRALYCLSFGPKKEYVETDFKPVEYRLGTTLIAFLSTDFASLRAKLLVRTTPMMENQAITEIKNALSAIHPFGERFVQSLFFEISFSEYLLFCLQVFLLHLMLMPRSIICHLKVVMIMMD